MTLSTSLADADFTPAVPVTIITPFHPLTMTATQKMMIRAEFSGTCTCGLFMATGKIPRDAGAPCIITRVLLPILALINT